MELVPSDSSLFRAAIDGLKDFLGQAQLQFSVSGLRVNGMDASHVGFVNYFLAAADCEVLTIPASASLVVGIDLKALSSVLAPIGKGDRLSLSVKDAKLIVAYTNEKLGKKVTCKLHTLDLEVDALELPDGLAYPAKIVARTTDVAATCKEVGTFGDTMDLRLDGEGFHVSTKGDHGDIAQTLENTEERTMELPSGEEVNASFGTRYLTTILKSGGALSATATLEFDPATPLRASFRFGSASSFVAYLAPKIVDA